MLLYLAALASCRSFNPSIGPITIVENSKTEWKVSQNSASTVIQKTDPLVIDGPAANIIQFTTDADNTQLTLDLKNLRGEDPFFEFLDLNGPAKILFKTTTVTTGPGFYSVANNELIAANASESESLSVTATPEPTEDNLDKTALALAIALPLCTILAFVIGFLIGLCCSRRYVTHRSEGFGVRDHYQQPINDRPIFQNFNP